MHKKPLLQYFSRHGQDKYLNEEIFKNRKHGVFVDIGAYDGIESSNTYFFEKELSWRGICVEPLVDSFEKLKKNRNSLCYNKCVLDKAKIVKFMHVIPQKKYRILDEEKPVNGKFKIREANIEKMSGIYDFFEPQHLKRIDNNLEMFGGKKEFFEIEAIGINDLLNNLSNQKIDYLTIDTEGSDFLILQAIDFKKFKIEVIEIEVLYPVKGLSEFMQKNGYSLLKKIGYDWLYRKNHSNKNNCAFNTKDGIYYGS